jgi:hypothetical protein
MNAVTKEEFTTLLPHELDPMFVRQAGLHALSRVEKWLTFWLHFSSDQDDAINLMVSLNACLEARNTIIINLFAEACARSHEKFGTNIPFIVKGHPDCMKGTIQ